MEIEDGTGDKNVASRPKIGARATACQDFKPSGPSPAGPEDRTRERSLEEEETEDEDCTAECAIDASSSSRSKPMTGASERTANKEVVVAEMNQDVHCPVWRSKYNTQCKHDYASKFAQLDADGDGFVDTTVLLDVAFLNSELEASDLQTILEAVDASCNRLNSTQFAIAQFIIEWCSAGHSLPLMLQNLKQLHPAPTAPCTSTLQSSAQCSYTAKTSHATAAPESDGSSNGGAAGKGGLERSGEREAKGEDFEPKSEEMETGMKEEVQDMNPLRPEDSIQTALGIKLEPAQSDQSSVSQAHPVLNRKRSRSLSTDFEPEQSASDSKVPRTATSNNLEQLHAIGNSGQALYIEAAAHISVESTQKSPAEGESNPTKGHAIPDNSKHDAAVKREEDKSGVAATASPPEPPDSDVKIIAKSESQKPPIPTLRQPSQQVPVTIRPHTTNPLQPASECAIEFKSEFLSVCFEEEARRLRLAARAEVARALMKYNLFDTDGPDGLCEVLWAELGVECAQDLQFVKDADVDGLESSKLIKPIQARKLRGLLREQQAVLEVEMKPEALKTST